MKIKKNAYWEKSIHLCFTLNSSILNTFISCKIYKNIPKIMTLNTNIIKSEHTIIILLRLLHCTSIKLLHMKKVWSKYPQLYCKYKRIITYRLHIPNQYTWNLKCSEICQYFQIKDAQLVESRSTKSDTKKHWNMKHFWSQSHWIRNLCIKCQANY